MISAVIVIISYGLQAQDITGAWYGTLKLPAGQLNLVYHLTKTGDNYTATMDSPDQGAKDLPMDNVSFIQNKLTISAAKYGITYTGQYLPDSNKFNGTFSQGMANIPMYLTANAPVNTPAPARPQDPKDFPYKQEEVSFINPKAGDVLAGTLTMPASGEVKRLVILITGSGPQNRNEELGMPVNQRPFLVWSDWLTRQGIAVLRYDDRGIAKSTGIFGTATTADFAGDAQAAINYIKSRADLKQLDIGLMGHSEGGMIAPMIAAGNKDIKFIVMLAGPGVPIKELMLQQSADQMRLSGAPDSVIKLSASTLNTVYTVMNQYPGLPGLQFKQKIDSVLYKSLGAYPKWALGSDPVDVTVKKTSAQLTSNWFRYFINAVPADYLVKVKCPVLALDGTLDSQVKAGPNLQAIEDALRKGGNKHFKTVTMPGLNHLFQKAVTGSVAEYGQIDETVNPGVLKIVSDWINGL